MIHKPYKIVNVEEDGNTVTITYMSNDDPIPYSLFQCTFKNDEDQVVINELLHYCMKTENFLDIKGLYSSSFEQSLVQSLQEEIVNQADIS
ncbi:hypothetical protein [Bacillus suaedaesalsae]|uniref:DUF4176 domain-containing protein n=1 Tax=Bacillus suaedaesalsae TaxID=2810349 RepID=A0ABS2DI27_9BACI|nr:hypothetical protein [Bacillus suaedaesalsae]MBM6618140.1 hypothetical protein [Bacillus suaedaesalsae]